MQDPDGLTGLQGTALDLQTNWVNKHTLRQGPQVRYTNILVQDMDDPLLAPFSLTIDRQGQWSASDRVPPFAALVVKKVTATGGRHGRGRMFFPGIAPDSFQDGQFTSGYLQQWIDNFTGPVMARYGPTGTSNLNFMLRANLPDGAILVPVISFQPRPILGVQRRRNIGVGA
jgi:hypothetical protein